MVLHQYGLDGHSGYEATQDHSQHLSTQGHSLTPSVYGTVSKAEWHKDWGDWQTKQAAHAASQGDYTNAAWKAGLAANEYANAKWHAS